MKKKKNRERRYGERAEGEAYVNEMKLVRE